MAAESKLDGKHAEIISSGDESSIKHITQTIFEHAARISRESNISQLLQLNADLARDLTGADRCSLWLVDESSGEMWTKVAHGVKEIRLPLGLGIVGTTIAEDRSLIVNHPESDPRFLRSVDEFSGYSTRSLLTVPLRADGKVIGAMQVLNKAEGFSRHDVELLSLMSLYSAAEIQSERLRQEAEAARLLHWELEMAREVQQNLLPRELPCVAGVCYEGIFEPAESVGGDYYDFLELPGGLFSFTLGDVSGKGMPAAVLMASIQALLRSHLLQDLLPLSELIAKVSNTVYLCSSIDRYSTLFCGTLNAERTKLTYVNAGHPPPVILSYRTNQILRPPPSGYPIGLVAATPYDQTTIDVGPGDIIVCVSDGVSEVMNAAGETWDEAELEKIVLRYRDKPMKDLVVEIVRCAREYSAGLPQSDDITVSAVQVLPIDAPPMA